MSSITFSLIALGTKSSSPFIQAVKKLSSTDNEVIWLGQCHHWIHESTLSTDDLLGPGPEIQRWDYLLITTTALQTPILELIEKSWSITAPSPPDLPSTLPIKFTPLSNPALPPGWSTSDPSALEAANPPDDLEASLALSSRPFGSSTPLPLKTFISTFPQSDGKPIAMFNLLSYLPPAGREKYFHYVAAFQESVGKKFGGEGVVLGFGVEEYTGKGSGEEGEGFWEDVALIGYPSLWHFAAMLGSEGYADVDRRFKKGALRDNPLVCCTEVDLHEGQ